MKICSKHSVFISKEKKAVESQKFMVEIFCELAPSIILCETWYRKVEGRDFNIEDSPNSGRSEQCHIK